MHVHDQASTVLMSTDNDRETSVCDSLPRRSTEWMIRGYMLLSHNTCFLKFKHLLISEH